VGRALRGCRTGVGHRMPDTPSRGRPQPVSRGREQRLDPWRRRSLQSSAGQGAVGAGVQRRGEVACGERPRLRAARRGPHPPPALRSCRAARVTHPCARCPPRRLRRAVRRPKPVPSHRRPPQNIARGLLRRGGRTSLTSDAASMATSRT
jgi:hypothetical protein